MTDLVNRLFLGYVIIPHGWPRVSTRWTTSLSSKLNLPHAINFRAVCGAHVVTLRSKMKQRNLRGHTCGYHVGGDAERRRACVFCLVRVRAACQREFVIDNLLVRIHFIIVMIRWTGLAPWVFEFPFPGSRLPPTRTIRPNRPIAESRSALTETPKKGSLSIFSTDLYRGVIIPIFGNQSIGRIVRAGGARHVALIPTARALPSVAEQNAAEPSRIGGVGCQARVVVGCQRLTT